MGGKVVQTSKGVQSGMSENVAGFSCYVLGWLTGIIFLLIDKRPYVRFHAVRSVVVFGGLQIFDVVVWMIFGGRLLNGHGQMMGRWGIFWLAWALYILPNLVGLVLWILFMVKAYQGKKVQPRPAGITPSLIVGIKTVGTTIGGLVACLVLVLLVLRVTGFEPGDHTPGLWLRGNLVTTPVADWSFADNYGETLELQTRTSYLLPHSVTIGFVVINGQLYVMSGYAKAVEWPHGRIWNEEVARDPHVRLKIGDKLFDRTLSHVTDPVEKALFLQARTERYKRFPKVGLNPAYSENYEALRVMPDQ
jgi:uncharacterized membrane protein